ncbi:hypothetical protein EDC01DRAFT_187500 [Geopyxis carbonaria]|nr:hypothetical protein EDC01DRAFT_187500 [Geopyxis carbonaria]
MPTTVNLASYPALVGDRHWALWITTENQKVKMHAVGNPFQGFKVFIEEEDVEKAKPRPEVIFLGSTSASVEELGALANTIPAPGVSPRPLEPSDNCHTWAAKFLDLLISKDYLDPSARAIMDRTPKTKDG